MDVKARLRRLTYLAHRWLGVGGCLLMLVWFLSGIVMLYVGYPKLTPEERFASLPVLAADAFKPLAAAQSGGTLAVLTSVRGEPTYIAPTPDGPRAWSARTGQADGAVTADMAVAAAHAFWPAGAARYAGLIDEDRWTHSRGLDRHRPLHKVSMEGDAAGTLYVSSATGEVVLDAPIAQQRWNYVGAWLHWLYMARDRSVDPVWSWMVIALSAVCTVLAVSGTVVGVWRWRFRGRYKTGARTPYREGWMRWHHIIGLAFSAFVCTWIFSGLMSMNPGGLFAGSDPGPDRQAMAGAQLAAPIADPQPVLQVLHDAGFQPVQLEWRRMAGQPYVLARDAMAGSRIVRREDGALIVQPAWQPEAVLDAARALFPGATVQATLLDHYDAYYYARHAEAMNGGAPRGLPVLRLDFDTPAGDRVYVDLRTGEPVLSLSGAQRVGRWLFYFLHSWDTPALLNAGVGRDLALILLSLGGLAVSATGIVLGRAAAGLVARAPVELRNLPTATHEMTLPPEPYSPRRIATLGVWREAGHSIKAYGIHRDPDVAGPILSNPVTASVRAAVRGVLNEHAVGPRTHGLGYCIAHVGEEAVWLLVDWWISGGIVCQRMLSAPLARPDAFTPVNAPALACVWELAVIAHERDAWVRHMLTARPDADGYLHDALAAGRY